MGQLHNLHPSLFDGTKYQVNQPPPPAVDVEAAADAAFEAKYTAAEDRGTHLTMFAPARTLAASHSAERPYSRDPKEWAANKVAQSKREQPIGSGRPAEPGENTTYESVRQHGVQTPVLVSQGDSLEGTPGYTLHHGHHRVYSANEINPQMEIPLVHRERNQGDSDSSMMSMGGAYVSDVTHFRGWTDPTVKDHEY